MRKFAKIQDAVNAASPGDSIQICPGVYAEQVSINACAPDLIGVFFRNASGRLTHVAVRNSKLGSSFNACQSGSAILLQSGGGQKSLVDIADSSIHDYQKNGITANEVGTDVTIAGNTLTGLGSTNGAAQNGIQIGFGAAGTIRHNAVANHIWAPCMSADQRTQVFDGVELIGDGNTAERNRITHSDQAGVLVAGNGNVVRQNVINESAIGVLKIAGSTGNTIANNTYFNSPVKPADPPAGALKASPYR